jgi:hypothetical protein
VTPVRLRPEGLRIPWQALTAFAVALYALRSVLRGWDFRPDALDAVVFGGLAVILVARPLLARMLADEDEGEARPDAGDVESGTRSEIGRANAAADEGKDEGKDEHKGEHKGEDKD